MKKIIITVLIATLALGLVACIPKKELPTEEEWKTYLLWEEEFLQWRDGPAKDLCIYQIQNRNTHEIYFIGSLQECKDSLTVYHDSYIMPYTK